MLPFGFKSVKDRRQRVKKASANAPPTSSLTRSKLGFETLEARVMLAADMAEIVAAHKEQAATVRKGPTWLAALSGSVRPVVTYLIIVEWLAINWAIAWLIIDEEDITVNIIRAILDTDFMGLVSCVIAFWFGNRTFGKRTT